MRRPEGHLGERLAGLLRRLSPPRRSLLPVLLFLRSLDGLAQRSHQVDDLRLLLLLRLRELLALRLRAEQLEQLLAELVVVALGLEGAAQVLDERLRHLDLGGLELALAADLLRLTNLVRVVHGLENEHAVVRPDRSELLLVPDHDLGDRDLPRLLERSHEEAERLLGAVLRKEVVALLEIKRIALVGGDEVSDVDRVSEFDVEPIEILVLERNVLPLADLVAPNDVVGRNGLPVVLADLLVSDRRHVPSVQKVKLEVFRLRGREHAHRHADKPEGNRPAPDRPHGSVLPTGPAAVTARFPTSGPGQGRLERLWTLWIPQRRPATGNAFDACAEAPRRRSAAGLRASSAAPH